MANIVFLPVCSDCNAIIFDEVDYRRELLERFDSTIINQVITPYKCPVCGKLFNKIVMPTKLSISTDQILKAMEAKEEPI